MALLGFLLQFLSFTAPVHIFPNSRGNRHREQQHQLFPAGLPSKYYTGPMLLNFRVRMGTCVSNTTHAAGRVQLIIVLPRFYSISVAFCNNFG